MILTAIALAVCPVSGERISCVHDGDSIIVERERIRIANIDAPELNGRCVLERAKAIEARNRLVTLLRPGFTLQRTGKDRYGRTLATITASGQDVGAAMVREGLARKWAGRRMPWCLIP